MSRQGRGLVASMALGTVLVACLPGMISAAEPARDARTREQILHERATQLRSQIALGWAPEDVTRIMGRPEHVGRHTDGGDVVETWWYHGFQIGVEFRRGGVSNWFFRFMK